MSTPATIGVVQRNGLIKAIYVHYDGYPAGVGELLEQHYNTLQKAEELLKLGDLISLKQLVDEKQSPLNIETDGFLADSRDYRQTKEPASVFSEVDAWLRCFSGADFAYLFNGGVWKVVSAGTKTPQFLEVGRQVADQE